MKRRILHLLAATTLVLTLGRQAAARAPTYQVTNLGVLSGDTHSNAAAINASGQVAGVSKRLATRTAPAHNHAVLWLPVAAYGRPAGVVDLGTRGATNSSASDVNALGQVVGMSDTPPTPFYPNGDRHPFVWLPVAAYGLPAGMTDLRELMSGSGWSPQNGARINDAGQILGADGDLNRAFLLDLRDRSITDLGSLGARNLPGALNNPVLDELGSVVRPAQVAGASYKSAGGRYYACRWDAANKLLDLNLLKSATDTSGLELTLARGINSAGLITGTGILKGGYERAYVLKPQ
jgi:uncharacterized membrane protein